MALEPTKYDLIEAELGELTPVSNNNNYDTVEMDIGELTPVSQSTEDANKTFMEETTFGGRLANSAKQGWLALKAMFEYAPRSEVIERGAQAKSGDHIVAYDPAGNPIWSSEVYTDEQQARVNKATASMGDAAIDDYAAAVAPLQAEMRNIPKRPATEAMLKAKDVGGMLEAFAIDPLGIMADIGISSAVQQLPALALTVATRKPAVAALAAGGNSYANELAGGVIDYLNGNGVDTADANQIVEALKDPAIAEESLSYARRGAAPVAALDAVSGGLAGKTFIPDMVMKQGAAKDIAGTFVTQPIVQGVMGATGETGKQLAQQGEITGPGEIFAEAIGEFSTAPVEAGSMAFERYRNRPKDNLDLIRDKIIDDIATGNEALQKALPAPTVVVTKEGVAATEATMRAAEEMGLRGGTMASQLGDPAVADNSLNFEQQDISTLGAPTRGTRGEGQYQNWRGNIPFEDSLSPEDAATLKELRDYASSVQGTPEEAAAKAKVNTFLQSKYGELSLAENKPYDNGIDFTAPEPVNLDLTLPDDYAADTAETPAVTAPDGQIITQIEELRAAAKEAKSPFVKAKLNREAELLEAEWKGKQPAMTKEEAAKKRKLFDSREEGLSSLLRKMGGLDTEIESDFAGRLNHLNKPGQKGLENPGRGKGGVTLDDLLERANEEGFAFKDVAELSDALETVARGDEVYSQHRSAGAMDYQGAKDRAASRPARMSPDDRSKMQFENEMGVLTDENRYEPIVEPEGVEPDAQATFRNLVAKASEHAPDATMGVLEKGLDDQQTQELLQEVLSKPAEQKQKAQAGNRFESPYEYKVNQYNRKADEHRLTPSQRQAFMPEDTRDNVTGLYGDPDRMPTMRRAREHIEANNTEGAYIDIDLRNLGGLNAHFGNHTGANKVFKAFADMIAEGFKGVDVALFRHGGDEMSVVLPTTTAAAAHDIMTAVQAKIDQYVIDNGLTEIPHSKYSGKSPEVQARAKGTGIYFGVAAFDTDISDIEIIKAAETITEASKPKELKGINTEDKTNVNESTNETAGPGQTAERRSPAGTGQTSESDTGAGAQKGSVSAEVIAEAAAEANGHNATTPQQKAGNYQKGHVYNLQGLNISIENEAGTKRKPMWPALAHHYGYIKGTQDRTGEHIDVFVKKDTDIAADNPIFVINQNDQKTGEFDEYKIMLGFDSLEDAKQGYLDSYSKGFKGFGSIHEVTPEAFRDWLENGDTTVAFAPNNKGKQLAAAPVYDGMTVEFNGKRYPVESFEDASKKYRKVIEQTGVGARDSGPDPMVFDANGKQIGHISYNGKVWPGKKEDWSPMSRPLYPVQDTDKARQKLADLWDKFDNTGEIQSHQEFVDEVDALAAETTDNNLKMTLDDMVEEYRNQQRDDLDLGGRGDMDAAEEVFNDDIKKLLSVWKGFEKAQKQKAEAVGTAPEHAQVGVDARELSEIVEEFNSAMEGEFEGNNPVTKVFVAPKKDEIVRLSDKVKVYNKDHGWMTVAEAKAKIDEWEQHALDQYENDGIRSANQQRVVLSLFDLSGEWSRPWEQAGYQVYRFDIQDGWANIEIDGEEINPGDIHNFSHELFAELFGHFDGADVYAILAACPCTDFAVSGARHFAAKDADGRTVASVKLVHATLAAIEYFKPSVWALENPVGRIEKLGGLPPWRLSFDPNHVGDPYTKKTLIWGRFNADLPVAPVEPTEGSKMHKLYGGKSQKTKNARSVTPEGFAYSFFMANNAHDHPAMALANKFDRLDGDLIKQALDVGHTESAITEAVEDFYYQDLDDEAANEAIQELIDNPPAPPKKKAGKKRAAKKTTTPEVPQLTEAAKSGAQDVVDATTEERVFAKNADHVLNLDKTQTGWKQIDNGDELTLVSVDGKKAAHFETEDRNSGTARQRMIAKAHAFAIDNPYQMEESAPAELESKPLFAESNEQEVTAILDAANVTGKDRLDIMAKYRSGEYTLDDIRKAYPAKAEAKQVASGKELPAELAAQFKADAREVENAQKAIRKFDPKPGPNGEYVHESRAKATTRSANLSNASALWKQKKTLFKNDLRKAAVEGYAIPQEYLDVVGSSFEYNEDGNYEPVVPNEINTVDAGADTNVATTEDPAATQAEPVQPAATVAYFADVSKRLDDGNITLDEYKSAFELLASNEEAITAELSKKTKAELLDMMDYMSASRVKNDKKDIVSRTAYRSMLGDFVLGNSYQYSHGKDGMKNGIRAVVSEQTAETLKEYADGIKQRTEDAIKQREETMAGVADPQTLDDFMNFIRENAKEGMTFQDIRMQLTPDQRVKFDELAAEKTRNERKARADQQKTEVKVAAQTTGAQIVEGVHSKLGHKLWSVQLADKVDGDSYKTLLSTAKRMGGNYVNTMQARMWKTVWGFQFRDEDTAKAFMQLAAGDTTAAQEKVQERRDAFADDRSQSAVERLNEMADKLDERADEVLSADRKTNTARRARFAASAENAANSNKAMAQTMRNIASAIESGKAKFLDRVRQKTQVEMLQGFVNTAQYDELRKKYPDYSEYEKHKGEAPTIETADYVKFPDYTLYRSDLARLGRELVETEGTKRMGQAILNVADDTSDAYLKFAKENLDKVNRFRKRDGSLATFRTKRDAEASIQGSGLAGKAIVLTFKRNEHLLVLSPSEAIVNGIWDGDKDKRITLKKSFGNEVVEKIGKAARRGSKISVPWQFDNAYDKLKRLAGMGIETPAELRAAVREFINLREAPAEEDKIKKMERDMIGRAKDGLDFFPTPADTADQMIETADIQEGMSVLEPSAGMGHIAERIRAAGVDPDVIEMSSARRELLEAKGFNVVGSDFMEMTPRGFTYGDVFKHKDGREGVMRGSGGLGSGRVGFIPDGKTTREWVDRDDLTGVRKNGSNSGYDRIIMNPPFSNRRDVEHVRHAYDLLKPGGRLVAIMGEGSFFGSDKKAVEFRDWLDAVGGTSEKLDEGTFLDPSLPVNTGVNARMVVIEKQESKEEIRFSKYSYEKGGKGAGITQAQADEAIAQFLEELGKPSPIDIAIAPTKTSIMNADSLSAYGNDRVRGYYVNRPQEKGGGAIVLILEDLNSVDDAIQTLRHEWIAHHGLNTFKPDDKKKIINRIRSSRGEMALKKAWQYVDENYPEASPEEQAEELLAYMTENKPSRLSKLWNDLVLLVEEALKAIGWMRKNRTTKAEIIRFIEDLTARVGAGAQQQIFKGDTAYSKAETNEVGDTFYSQMARVLEQKLQNSGTALQMRNTIQAFANKGEFKAEELEWSGVTEWLDSRPLDKVTKAEVLDFLKANRIQVQEVTKGETVANAITDWEDHGNGVWVSEKADVRIEEIGGEFVIRSRASGGSIVHTRQTLEGAKVDAADFYLGAENLPQTDTKFSQYQLPGGENYRELLLTLPRIGAELLTAEEHERLVYLEHRKKSGALDMIDVFSKDKSLLEEMKSLQKRKRGTEFKSSHYDELNIVAHVRFNERVDAEGKRVLFVEEVQSDFGQDYKKSVDAIRKAVNNDFQGIVERMKNDGALKVECD